MRARDPKSSLTKPEMPRSRSAARTEEPGAAAPEESSALTSCFACSDHDKPLFSILRRHRVNKQRWFPPASLPPAAGCSLLTSPGGTEPLCPPAAGGWHPRRLRAEVLRVLSPPSKAPAPQEGGGGSTQTDTQRSDTPRASRRGSHGGFVSPPHHFPAL